MWNPYIKVIISDKINLQWIPIDYHCLKHHLIYPNGFICGLLNLGIDFGDAWKGELVVVGVDILYAMTYYRMKTNHTLLMWQQVIEQWVS